MFLFFFTQQFLGKKQVTTDHHEFQVPKMEAFQITLYPAILGVLSLTYAVSIKAYIEVRMNPPFLGTVRNVWFNRNVFRFWATFIGLLRGGVQGEGVP